MASVDLNVRMTHAARVKKSLTCKVEVCFNEIESFLYDLIRDERVDDCLVCMAWMKSRRLRSVLPPGSRCVVQSEKHLTFDSVPDGVECRKVGLATGGARRPLMHNKFCVLRRRGEPTAVVTGSYNWTNHSLYNLENVVVLHDAQLAATYAREFEAIWNLGRRVPRKRKRKR